MLKVLLDQIAIKPGCKYSSEVAKGLIFCCCSQISFHYYVYYQAGIKRCFENLRRNYNEQKEGKEEYVETQSKRRKYRYRWQRVSYSAILIYFDNSFSKTLTAVWEKGLGGVYKRNEFVLVQAVTSIHDRRIGWRGQSRMYHSAQVAVEIWK